MVSPSPPFPNGKNTVGVASVKLSVNKVSDVAAPSPVTPNNVPVESNIDITLNTKDEYIIQRDTDIAGFFGSFYINFQIPQFLGLGKSVTRGFGTVKQS